MRSWISDFLEDWGVYIAIVVVLSLMGIVIVVGVANKSDSESRIDRTVTQSHWESIGNGVYRTETPDGWLVVYYTHAAVYVPDAEHRWLRRQERE